MAVGVEAGDVEALLGEVLDGCEADGALSRSAMSVLIAPHSCGGQDSPRPTTATVGDIIEVSPNWRKELRM